MAATPDQTHPDHTHAVPSQAASPAERQGWVGADGLAAVHLEGLSGLRVTALLAGAHLHRMVASLTDDNLDRLLGGGGVIAGFASICRVACLVMDKERKNFDMTAPKFGSYSPSDEIELERRITDELGRIAARKRLAALGAPDCADL